jgi:hypothetical protein
VRKCWLEIGVLIAVEIKFTRNVALIAVKGVEIRVEEEIATNGSVLLVASVAKDTSGTK